MKKKEWKQRCAELQDQVIKVIDQARSWRKKYISAIRTTGSLKRYILNKHLQCNKLAANVVQLREAAEFEARVAAKLARTIGFSCCHSECPWNRMNPKDTTRCVHSFNSSFCRLRAARCAVEEEMDNE